MVFFKATRIWQNKFQIVAQTEIYIGGANQQFCFKKLPLYYLLSVKFEITVVSSTQQSWLKGANPIAPPMATLLIPEPIKCICSAGSSTEQRVGRKTCSCHGRDENPSSTLIFMFDLYSEFHGFSSLLASRLF